MQRNMRLRENDFINALRQMPLHDGARNLNDDAAVIAFGDQNLVFTKDMMVAGVHYFHDADPADIAWKLVAVNLSDLAAKGAKPLGVMLGFTLGCDDWDKHFLIGFHAALKHFDIALLGGDTVSAQERVLSLTAIGLSEQSVPARSDAKAGDILSLSGPVGDAFAGYEMIKAGNYDKTHPCVLSYNRPAPLLELGSVLAPNVNAMMDVSDGLFMDARRLASASGCKIDIQLENIPLSKDYISRYGSDLNARLSASNWGDDYQLLCSVPNLSENVRKIPKGMTPIGRISEGSGLDLSYRGDAVSVPKKLGYEH